mgnify:CR=1 FL=1
MLTMNEALLALRTEGNQYNQEIISDLLAAIPSYISTTTGIQDPAQAAVDYPLLKTLAKFLLCLWYNPDGTDAVQLQVVVNNLLKTLKAMAAEINAKTEAE